MTGISGKVEGGQLAVSASEPLQAAIWRPHFGAARDLRDFGLESSAVGSGVQSEFESRGGGGQGAHWHVNVLTGQFTTKCG